MISNIHKMFLIGALLTETRRLCNFSAASVDGPSNSSGGDFLHFGRLFCGMIGMIRLNRILIKAHRFTLGGCAGSMCIKSDEHLADGRAGFPP